MRRVFHIEEVSARHISRDIVYPIFGGLSQREKENFRSTVLGAKKGTNHTLCRTKNSIFKSHFKPLKYWVVLKKYSSLTNHQTMVFCSIL